MTYFGIYAMLAALLALADGCGKKLGDAQTADVGNVIGGLQQTAPGASASIADRNMATAGADENTIVGHINTLITGRAWLEAFKLGANEMDLAPFLGTRCPASTSVAGMSCTSTCSTDGTKATDACKLSNTSQKQVCNGVTYTATNETIDFTIDFSNVTGTGTSLSGVMAMGLNFSANLTGGSLDGKLLACNITIGLDFGALLAGKAESAAAVGCGDNFNCTYDGVKVDCAKLQSSYGSSACTAG